MLTRRKVLLGLLASPVLTVRARAATLIEKEGRASSFCQTGDKYDTLCSQGIKQEGASARRYSSADAAWSAYSTALADYKRGRTGVLYWRQRPVLESATSLMVYGYDEWGTFKPEQIRTEPGYFVYSRLVISDKPEIYSEKP